MGLCFYRVPKHVQWFIECYRTGFRLKSAGVQALTLRA